MYGKKKEKKDDKNYVQVFFFFFPSIMVACEPIGWPWGVHGGDSNTQWISSLCKCMLNNNVQRIYFKLYQLQMGSGL